jgi:serine/threonine-protein kinase
VVTTSDYLWVSISPTIAVGVAYFGSQVVYGLNVDIAEAERVGSYRLETLLGEGGMGQVWKAKHQMLARPAAIKLMRPEVLGVGDTASPKAALRRFEREAQATALMRSPHTIQIYDFGVTDEGAFYYVMELLNGLDLQDLVARFGPLPYERAVHLLRQVCASLEEAHVSGLIHRDIKPANVYACCYGLEVDFVKVLDFGLAKVLQPEASGDPPESLTQTAVATRANVVMGTAAYMSPEQVLGDHPVEARSDIYAVGCLAYWLLAGQTVFTATSSMALLLDHAHTTPLPPSARTELPIPRALDAAVLSCLEKDPSKRPASAGTLSDRLAAVPLAEAWSPNRARRWWETYRPEDIRSFTVRRM